ncbi:hypothetical protein FAIPA1_10282 [Frankia sp. AiPs1]
MEQDPAKQVAVGGKSGSDAPIATS